MWAAWKTVHLRWPANCVGRGRRTEVQELLLVGARARQFEHRITTEREPHRADAVRVETGTERRIGEQAIEHFTDISGTLPPEAEALKSHPFHCVIARMIHTGHD